MGPCRKRGQKEEKQFHSERRHQHERNSQSNSHILLPEYLSVLRKNEHQPDDTTVKQPTLLSLIPYNNLQWSINLQIAYSCASLMIRAEVKVDSESYEAQEIIFILIIANSEQLIMNLLSNTLIDWIDSARR